MFETCKYLDLSERSLAVCLMLKRRDLLNGNFCLGSIVIRRPATHQHEISYENA